jgi:hypothetical protein
MSSVPIVVGDVLDRATLEGEPKGNDVVHANLASAMTEQAEVCSAPGAGSLRGT